MTFDPAVTDIKFFIRRIRIVAQQEGVQAVLNVLPNLKEDVPELLRRIQAKQRQKQAEAK